MITFFTTAKPFEGHIGLIQHNALKSWTMLDPAVQVVLFGDDEGAAQIAKELGIRHEPDVARNEFGTVRIDSMFAKAQAMARNEIVCYANCDIILLADFAQAVRVAAESYKEFLAIGRRWNVDISESTDLSRADWQSRVREVALAGNQQQDDWFIDYFVFTRGLFAADVPALAVGRGYWDNWVVWKALQTGHPVLDLSPSVLAVHQNHDYLHHPAGRKGVYSGPEAMLNLRLGGGRKHLRCIGDATRVVEGRRIKWNGRRYWVKFGRLAPWLARFVQFRVWNPILFFLLGLTRPLRSVLGLRRKPSHVSAKQ
jgi:hypothetical protein